jgi:hypothetical protein
MPIFANALAFSKTLLTSKLVKRDQKNIIAVEIIDTFDSFSSLEDKADFASYLLLGQWMYIVNLPGNILHQQGIVTEECT